MADTSFIPKDTDDFVKTRHQSVGILMAVGLVLFIASIGALIGVIYYRQNLNTQIEEMTQDIKRKEKEFDQSQIQEWARTAEAIDLAKQVISKHKYATNVFKFIGSNTLPDVRFSKFEFDANTNKINLSAESKGYTALAQQREIFAKNPLITGINLKNFNLDKSGRVLFDIELIIKPSLTSTN